MGRSTRLFQRTGSPLIQGSSKSVRPWWQALAGSAAAGVFGPLPVWWYVAVSDGRTLPGAALDALQTWFERSPGVLLGSLIGAVLGVALASSWGARRRWIPGVVLAVAGSLGGIWVFGMLAS
ncbi:MAG: hypothetical protein Q8K99_02400 [Actinomycetota bacterium]|nr:hypothetical protein [Actinomycetota bacterium]